MTDCAMGDEAHSLFVSDLHLALERPGLTRRFLHFLERRAPLAERLYILGDLFDAYVGDDDWTPPVRNVRRALRTLTGRGVAVHLQRGNRDFLIGERFALETGAQMLPDCQVVDLYGTPVLLLHGDLLCTDDHAYQAFRQKSHDPVWQRQVLSRPLWMRLAYARWYRLQSLRHKRRLSQEIMDVNQGTVRDYLERHGVRCLVHGHTHRPAVHRWQGRDGECTRIVLSDWGRAPQALVWGAGGYRMEELA